MWETCKLWLTRYNLWDDHTALRLLSGLLFPRRRWPEGIQHIVIYRVGNIGDTVVAIPAMAALRDAFPSARITLLTSTGQADLPGALGVLSAFPKLVDKIVSYKPAHMRSLQGLQKIKAQVTAHGPIDLWISLPATLQGIFRGYREVLLARIFRSRKASGFTVLLPEFFKQTYVRHHALPKTSDWLLNLVQQALLQPGLNLAEGQGSPQAGDAEGNSLRYFESPNPDVLAQLGLNPQQPILVVNAGAKLAIKRWPANAFHQALAQVLIAFPQVQLVLLGNAEEQELNAEIARDLPCDLPGRVFNLSGVLSLPDTWSLIHQCTAVLSNDTGVMHMAGLLQKPVFTPMSGQYPAPLWHPPGPEIQIFEHAVPCAPCFKSHCPLPRQLCLTEIQPATLGDALCAFFESQR